MFLHEWFSAARNFYNHNIKSFFSNPNAHTTKRFSYFLYFLSRISNYVFGIVYRIIRSQFQMKELFNEIDGLMDSIMLGNNCKLYGLLCNTNCSLVQQNGYDFCFFRLRIKIQYNVMKVCDFVFYFFVDDE